MLASSRRLSLKAIPYFLTGTESPDKEGRCDHEEEVVSNRRPPEGRTSWDTAGRPSEALETEAPRLQALYVVELSNIEWEKLLPF